jgi:pimeloyl-ACP methyl ester carboxylesterase
VRHRERVVSAGDAEVLVREWGSEGPPIFFWHALGDHTSLQLVDAAPILVDEFGYRLVGVDAPGFGGSPRLPDERYEIPALIELALDFLDTLGLDPVVWAGSSWGGIIGVQFAAAHPERLAALVLVDGGYLDPEHEHGDSLDEARAYWRSQPGWRFPSWDAALADARETFPRWSPGMEEYVRSAYREENGEVVSTVGPDVYAAAMHGIDGHRLRGPTRGSPQSGCRFSCSEPRSRQRRTCAAANGASASPRLSRRPRSASCRVRHT